MISRFRCNYKADSQPDLPSGSEGETLLYFPDQTSARSRGAAVVRVVHREGADWIGVFQSGYKSPKSFSGLVAMPDPDCLCVIADGAGYLVNTLRPRDWAEVESFPITDVVAAADKNLVVFIDLTTAVAYSGLQKLWKTERLSWDGIEIKEVRGATLVGLALDATRREMVKFEVDLDTGRHRGGAAPK